MMCFPETDVFPLLNFELLQTQLTICCNIEKRKVSENLKFVKLSYPRSQICFLQFHFPLTFKNVFQLITCAKIVKCTKYPTI